MGNEAKPRKRRSPDSDDEERSRKHRKRDARESKSRKDKGKDDKKKSKSEKSHEHSRSRDSNEKEKEKKHKSKRQIEELTGDDYYSKNNEFSTWLKEEKGIFFSDLSSEAAKDLFSRFVKAWNSQKLGSQYYKGITHGPRTTHKWNIKQGKEASGLL